MATDTIVKTDRQFLDSMIQRIMGTHWTKRELVCPVFPMKRVKVRRKENPSGFGYDLRTDRTQPPIKISACLVGVAMIEGGLIPDDPKDWLKIIFDELEKKEGDSIDPDDWELLDDLSDDKAVRSYSKDPREEIEQVKRVIRKLHTTLIRTPHLLKLNQYGSAAHTSQTEIVSTLEGWNDSDPVEKEHVIELIELTRDNEPPDPV